MVRSRPIERHLSQVLEVFGLAFGPPWTSLDPAVLRTADRDHLHIDEPGGRDAHAVWDPEIADHGDGRERRIVLASIRWRRQFDPYLEVERLQVIHRRERGL